MEMKLKKEDGNDLEKYLKEIAGKLYDILKGKVSRFQLVKFSLLKRRGLGKAC